MNIKDISKTLAQRTGLPATKTQALTVALLDEIYNDLWQGKRVRLKGIGTLFIRAAHRRGYYNINSKQHIPASKELKVVFQPDEKLKKKLRACPI